MQHFAYVSNRFGFAQPFFRYHGTQPLCQGGGGGGAAEKLHQLKCVAHLETNLELLGCGFKEMVLPGCRPSLDGCANSSTKLGTAGPPR